jgi:hypothetical protein
MMSGFTNCSSKWLPIFILKVVCLITYQFNINNDIHIPFWVFSDFFWGGGNSGFFGGIPGRKLSYTHQQETLRRNSNREREWIVIFIFNKSARIWRPRACLESIYLFIYLLKTSLNTVTNQPVLKYLQIERLLFIRPWCTQTTTPPPSPSEPLPKSVKDTVTIYLTD